MVLFSHHKRLAPPPMRVVASIRLIISEAFSSYCTSLSNSFSLQTDYLPCVAPYQFTFFTPFHQRNILSFEGISQNTAQTDEPPFLKNSSPDCLGRQAYQLSKLFIKGIALE
jgi:hypothetical protein